MRPDDRIKPISAASKKKAIKRVTTASEHVHSYDFDENGQWLHVRLQFPTTAKRLLFVSLIESAAKKTVIRATSGLTVRAGSVAGCGVVEAGVC